MGGYLLFCNLGLTNSTCANLTILFLIRQCALCISKYSIAYIGYFVNRWILKYRIDAHHRIILLFLEYFFLIMTNKMRREIDFDPALW